MTHRHCVSVWSVCQEWWQTQSGVRQREWGGCQTSPAWSKRKFTQLKKHDHFFTWVLYELHTYHFFWEKHVKGRHFDNYPWKMCNNYLKNPPSLAMWKKVKNKFLDPPLCLNPSQNVPGSVLAHVPSFTEFHGNPSDSFCFFMILLTINPNLQIDERQNLLSVFKSRQKTVTFFYTLNLLASFLLPLYLIYTTLTPLMWMKWALQIKPPCPAHTHCGTSLWSKRFSTSLSGWRQVRTACVITL